MTDDEIIAEQARQIIMLSRDLASHKKAIERAILHIVCVGGPLNDNKLKFTNEQQQVFSAILGELE